MLRRSSSRLLNALPPEDRADLQRWRRMMLQLPSVRMDLILTTQEALRCSCYENDEVLDATVQRLGDELARLSHRTTIASPSQP